MPARQNEHGPGPFFSRALCLVVALFFVAPACAKKEAKPVQERVVQVRVQAAEKKPLRPFLETIGSLYPDEEVVVSAEVDGALQQVNVDEGSVVSKGMVLATIDPTDYGLEVKRAEAALRQAEANLANTRLEFGRKEALYKEELVTKQQFDDVSTRLSLAEAELERVSLTLSLSRQRMEKTRITSPLSGVVKEKKVSAGDYVRTGTNLFAIIRNNPIKLRFTVAEKDAGKVRKGQDVVLRVDALPGKEFKGKVSIVYPSLDDQTRTLPVEGEVPNSQGLLKPGLFAQVVLYTGAAKETVVVPVTSLLYEEDKVKVFVTRDGLAREREVALGSKHGDVMEITSGLKAGEEVVVVGQQNLSEGMKVNVAR